MLQKETERGVGINDRERDIEAKCFFFCTNFYFFMYPYLCSFCCTKSEFQRRHVFAVKTS